MFFVAALSSQQRAHDQQKQASPSYQTQESASQNIGLRPSNRKQSVKTDWNKPKCGAAQSHDEADLCEQIKMAKAADSTLWWTRFGIITGLVGFAFVIVNLIYVRLSTDAAIEANRLNREAFVSEHRTWMKVRAVKVGPIGFRDGRIISYVTLQAENVGKTPAISVFLACKSFSFRGSVISGRAIDALLADQAFWLTNHRRMGMVVMPSDLTGECQFGQEVEADFRGEQESASAIAAGASPRMGISVAYAVFYKSVASNEWRHSAHVLAVIRKDGADFDPALGPVHPSNLSVTFLDTDSQMT